jgi:hypothetical protein
MFLRFLSIRKQSFHILLTLTFLLNLFAFPAFAQGNVNPNPPDEAVRLIFIHHSCGENWLDDENGGLGRALDENNYFVSDTNYGWGPDSIGDRTDIINWREWFTGSDSDRYMEAVYNEDGQNSYYTRSMANPGGENEIILFKSCFPNSNLEGSPNDPPQDQGDWLTVANAKFIYNDLLNYFKTRPDKLFIVITAPPVQDREYASNARAFNTWLVEDWLAENNYPFPNVAVFDFYNILTGKNNHHRVVDGAIEYITDQGKNTAAYPTEDDHPSSTGNRKATDEFVPLLNVYYHRWHEGLPSHTIPLVKDATPDAGMGDAGEQPSDEEDSSEVTSPVVTGFIDNFDAEAPVHTGGWEYYAEEGSDSKMVCSPDSSAEFSAPSALHMVYDLAPGSWGTCSLFYDEIQNWGDSLGISFYLQAAQAGQELHLEVFGGSPGGRISYIYYLEIPPESVDGWFYLSIPWEDILRAEWEEGAGSPIDPGQITGFGFGFSGLENTRLSGQLWIDDLMLLGLAPAIPELYNEPPFEETPSEGSDQEQVEAAGAEADEPADSSGRRSLPCGSAAFLPLAMCGAILLQRKFNRKSNS